MPRVTRKEVRSHPQIQDSVCSCSIASIGNHKGTSSPLAVPFSTWWTFTSVP